MRKGLLFKKLTRYKKLYLKSAFNYNIITLAIKAILPTNKVKDCTSIKTYNKSQENWVNITEFT